jgi:ribosomal protein L37AE/L43A
MVNILELEDVENICPYCGDLLIWKYMLELWVCDSCRIHI